MKCTLILIFETTNSDRNICYELDYRRSDKYEITISKNFYWIGKTMSRIEYIFDSYSSLRYREINDNRLLKSYLKFFFTSNFLSVCNKL